MAARKKVKYRFNPKYVNCKCGCRVKVEEAMLDDDQEWICVFHLDKQFRARNKKPYWFEDYAYEKDWQL